MNNKSKSKAKQKKTKQNKNGNFPIIENHFFLKEINIYIFNCLKAFVCRFENQIVAKCSNRLSYFFVLVVIQVTFE